MTTVAAGSDDASPTSIEPAHSHPNRRIRTSKWAEIVAGVFRRALIFGKGNVILLNGQNYTRRTVIEGGLRRHSRNGFPTPVTVRDGCGVREENGGVVVEKLPPVTAAGRGNGRGTARSVRREDCGTPTIWIPRPKWFDSRQRQSYSRPRMRRVMGRCAGTRTVATFWDDWCVVEAVRRSNWDDDRIPGSGAEGVIATTGGRIPKVSVEVLGLASLEVESLLRVLHSPLVAGDATLENTANELTTRPRLTVDGLLLTDGWAYLGGRRHPCRPLGESGELFDLREPGRAGLHDHADFGGTSR